MKLRFHIPRSIQNLIIGVLLFNILWLFIALIVKNRVLPSPLDVYEVMPQTLMEQNMWQHSWASLWRVILGTAIALVIGSAFGLLTAISRRVNKIMEPLLYLSYPVPKLALMPAVMIIFGIGQWAKIIMIVLIIVFQIIISIRDAIRRINRENFYVLQAFGASRWSILRHIVFPCVLPDIFSALRVTIGIAISVLFVTETFGTDSGLGFFIIDSWMRLNYLQMYAGIVMISIIGFLLFMTIDILDAIFCRWQKIIEKQ